MKQVVDKLKHMGLRRIVTVFLATILFVALPAFQANAVESATGEYNPVTPDTVKRIQEKAEDLGDAPGRRIGDTGLENIKTLPKKIPEVLNLKAKQTKVTFDTNEPNKKAAMDEAQAEVENKR
ncbi:MAG: hypothetical protein CLLPBCKN_003432 [Chroococcidiopsis cubana SAG 39.79]|jgi:hypothetical protein|uniref:Low temperature-induced protein n=2 Tax=Chroococcidiopsis TaxID=54298 RepID=K9TX60_CHRTP|nr:MULTISPECIES: hypothetical protein [Chroococcidiopsis]PSB49368.1 hypothetical protein C7B80_02670 [Cyanosarcina cf. burmensis CCALA 770]AFY86756.1 hypothetical protein Chro_1230 [Chroococcidiopsis thermalis PCC 7203]MDZ4874036.1 hypothetical protein [Chroococcidiopsis cubana SAG 39.79]PSB59884.1 hypothetical protein C7B79_27825 [Chroococcidiopsis cubana CCALA 043]PSM47074.1 hypothetical protein C7Y66_21775 [Chroococcidiopsis sp. CCALA 051]